MIRLYVAGIPAPQGSKRHVGNGRMVEMSKAVGPWREAVRAETQRAAGRMLAGPVEVLATFVMPRPKAHYGTGRNALNVKASAPRWPAGRPDVDKLLRAVLDGLTMGSAFADDAQVVRVSAVKRYGDKPGVHIWIRTEGEWDGE